MTRLFDVYRGDEFLMRASLRGVVLFVPLDGSAAARIVVEQLKMGGEEPTLVSSCGVPSAQFSVRVARESLPPELK